MLGVIDWGYILNFVIGFTIGMIVYKAFIQKL